MFLVSTQDAEAVKHNTSPPSHAASSSACFLSSTTPTPTPENMAVQNKIRDKYSLESPFLTLPFIPSGLFYQILPHHFIELFIRHVSLTI